MIIHTITLFSFTFCSKSLTYALRKNHDIRIYYGLHFYWDNLVPSSSYRSHCTGTKDLGGIFIAVHRHSAWCYFIQYVYGHWL